MRVSRLVYAGSGVLPGSIQLRVRLVERRSDFVRLDRRSLSFRRKRLLQ